MDDIIQPDPIEILNAVRALQDKLDFLLSKRGPKRVAARHDLIDEYAKEWRTHLDTREFEGGCRE